MNKRFILLGFALILIVVIIYFLESMKPQIDTRQATIDLPSDQQKEASIVEKSLRYPRAKEFVAPAGFLNVDGPFEIADIIGKQVILIDFWTYSCINCQRTFPYLKAWYDQYKDQGLTMIGIHTPEFDFEKERANVEKALERFGIQWPVVQDNDYGTWRAYMNRYWPRKYLIDIDGFIVYDHIGEGGYAETESKIQELLQERAERLDLAYQAPETAKPTDVIIVRAQPERISPEIYFGALRNQYFTNGKVGQTGFQSLPEPENIQDESLYLAGEWNIENEFSENESPYAKIIYRYKAKDVFMVLSAEKATRVKVLRDGKIVGLVAGADVDEESSMQVSDERLYKIIANDEPSEFHTLELIIGETGLKAYTFTFG